MTQLDLAYLQAHLLRLDMPLRLAVRRAQQAGFDPNNDFQGLYISEDDVERYLALTPGAGLWDTQLPLPEFSDNYRAQYDQIIEHLQTIETEAHHQGLELRLRHVASSFDLTADDVDILLLCAASSIDRRYERLFGYLQDDITKRDASVYLIINLLGQTLEQRQRIQARLVADAPLRRYALIHPYSEQPNQPFIRQMLQSDNRLTSYLQGIDTIPRSWQSFLRVYDDPITLDDLVIDADTRDSIRHLSQNRDAFFYFSGTYGSGKRSTAQAIAYELGRPMVEVDLEALQQSNRPRDVALYELLTVATREAILRKAVLFVSRWEKILDEDKRPPHSLWQSILEHPYPAIVSARETWEAFGTHRHRPMLRLNFDIPDYQSRLQHWRYYLEGTNIDAAELAYKFKLTGGQIRDAINTAFDLAAWRGDPVPTLADLYAGSRAQSNRNLSELAIKITPRYDWERIILPPDPLQQLREIADRLKQAIRVYEEWGFDGGIANARGMTVLFAGQSGTGKTMAAEVIARELGLEIFKIDLSSVVSKYIGETEKNLATIFDEAAQSNAILFFDEADALFGKRTEVNDSHDRYANIEVGYLLQRLETYDGIGILATNLRQNIDEAFTRRMDFLVDFPFPEPEYRQRIWEVSFPAQAPLGMDVDFNLLADRFRLSGGNIRNAAIAAAFFAASDESSTIDMRHIFQAIRREYQKMGKLLESDLALDRS